MAKDFNVYQWRRSHLTENQISENTPSWKEEFKDIMKVNNLTPSEVMDFISIYFKDEKGKPTMIGLNEEGEMMVSTLSFEDTKGKKLPYDITGGAWIEILRPESFEDWKDRFIRIYGDAKLNISGDKLIPSNERIDALNKTAASDIRGAVGTVD